MKILHFFKSNFISILFVIFTVLLVILGGSNLAAANNGLMLFANNVIPSLFPFFVAVELLKSTNLIYCLSRCLEKYMRPIFNVPGIAVFPFLMGSLSGFPVGAKIVYDLYKSNSCTKDEAERMLVFCNNAGPLFIVGTIGYAFYSNSIIGVILLLSHILASISAGIILGIKSKLNHSKKSEFQSSFKISKVDEPSFSNLGLILGNAIFSGIKSILNVGGFVVIFSVIISMLNKTQVLNIISGILHLLIPIDQKIISAFLSGLIEFTNGLHILSSVPYKNLTLKLAFSSFIIGLGGISVLLQVLSIIKSELSIKQYIKGRLLQASISLLYTYIIFIVPVFNLNI